MVQETAATDREFTALVVVSPMQLGGETKDQDRACWFEQDAIAALADGVTTSFRAAEAAELVAKAAAVLFKGSVRGRLRVLSDLLMSRRMEAMRSEVKLPPHSPPGIEKMLQQVAREARAQSYQTTLVAASFAAADGMAVVEVVCCGDSAFFAFRPDGRLLMSSQAYDRAAATEQDPDDGRAGPLVFAPGDELVARILSDGADRPRLLERAGIPPHSAGAWWICKPLDRVQAERTRAAARPDPMAMRLSSRDRLLVPKYLAGGAVDPRFHGFCRFPFSRMIRRLATNAPRPPAVAFNGRGSVTAVLPDHFYAGNWWHLQDRFPPDTEFVLASDGFYGGFASPEVLWDWLRKGHAALLDPSRREALLAELHASLHSKGGDDDISFVWVFPARNADAPLAESPHDTGGNHAR